MEMTKRERMMCALSGGQPDRVPCAPDVSCMIPCKMTGKPFYEVLMRGNPPIWRAYLDVVDYYDFEAWFIYGQVDFQRAYVPETKVYYEKDRHGYPVQVVEYDTPAGPLRRKTTFPTADAETITEKVTKDFKEDFPKFKYLFGKITGYDDTVYQAQKKALGERGMMAVSAFPASFSHFIYHFNGNLEAITYAYYDEPELFEELCEMFERDNLDQLDILLSLHPDSVLTGGSGSITLQSPAIFDEIALPGIKKIAQRCKEAGVICGVHSCGKEEHLIRRCAEETALSYVNPLEIPPMGDCRLADIKKRYGDRLALMGNLHTTNVMLDGTPGLVRLESLRALYDAAQGGGFVLSTGDQCGRDTPEENLRAMIAACREFGGYPLDLEAIRTEIKRLESVV